MTDLDLDALAAPLDADAPCGPDLEYDADFLALQSAGAGRPEQQYGDTLIPAEPPDWPEVQRLALALAGRTRDLRVLVWLLRARARLGGVPGAVRVLALLRRLLDEQWAHLHPALDADDGDDPTMRLNALAPLVHADAALADLRAAGLGPGRGSLRLRDLELALGRAEPAPGEGVPTETGVLEALAGLLATDPGLTALLSGADDDARAIAALVEARGDAALAPDFRPLTTLTRLAADAARRADGAAAATDPLDADGAAVSAGPSAAPGAVAAPGAIRSREDALQALERVCDWLETHEPAHPAPLLIRRAQRLLRKNFLEIIRDLVPDGLDQVERLAGSPDP